MLSFQLLAGANVNARNKNGMTCLHLAAADNHASICSVLIDNRIEFDSFDENHNNGMYNMVEIGTYNMVEIGMCSMCR